MLSLVWLLIGFMTLCRGGEREDLWFKDIDLNLLL